MATPRHIRVNQLLLEREALWLRVHEIEQEAAKWLREPYPFERPELPSDRKKKRRAVASERSGADAPRGEDVSAPKGEADRANEEAAVQAALRRLEDGEAAYRVSYVAHGKTATEEHEELEALRVVVASQGAHLRVTRIETVMGDGTVRATLLGGRSG